jgi:hypothetical protein
MDLFTESDEPKRQRLKARGWTYDAIHAVSHPWRDELGRYFSEEYAFTWLESQEKKEKA